MVYVSVYQYVCLSLSLCLSVCLSVCLSISLSVWTDQYSRKALYLSVNWVDQVITKINGTCSYISYFQQEDKDKNEMGPTDAILCESNPQSMLCMLPLDFATQKYAAPRFTPLIKHTTL